MNQIKMIVITGAGGFIGSYLANFLNQKGFQNLILSDDFEKQHNQNLKGVRFHQFIEKSEFLKWLKNDNEKIEFIFHLGAITDTTEQNKFNLDKWNTDYSITLWKICSEKQIPLIYASSAATYGNGSLGYDDDPQIIKQLKPLNLYGWSKQYFDEWVIKQTVVPPHWYGFKFFNVFGPHENLKGRMASVVYHGYHQIKNNGSIKLFKSNDQSILDGDQKRDFIFVDDVCNILFLFFQKRVNNGIYNLGTGKANSFNTLAHFTFKAMGLEDNIEYIPFPEDLLKVYQNFTEAKMNRLFDQIGDYTFIPFELAIKKYVDYLNSIN